MASTTLVKGDTTMTRLMMILLAVTAAAPAASAQTAECGTGLVDDVEVITRIVPQASVTTARRRPTKNGNADWFAYSMPLERVSKTYRVTVKLNDLTYVAESSGDGFWNYNAGRFIVNDSVPACVVKDRLVLRRPDGKDYRARIVRAERQP
jgi:hypothetical protein